MTDNEKKLGDMFTEAFQDHQIRDFQEEDWAQLGPKLRLQKFFSFDWSSFNIYYATAIFTSFFITVLMGTHYLLFLNSRNDQIEITKKVSDSKNYSQMKSSTDTHVSGETSAVKKVKQAPIENPSIKISSIKKPKAVADLVSNEVINPEPDNSALPAVKPDSSISAPVPDTVNERSNEPIIQEVIIYKQDTIIKYDSIKVKPKFPFLKKK